jgi:hypothetical protein
MRRLCQIRERGFVFGLIVDIKQFEGEFIKRNFNQSKFERHEKLSVRLVVASRTDSLSNEIIDIN